MPKRWDEELEEMLRSRAWKRTASDYIEDKWQYDYEKEFDRLHRKLEDREKMLDHLEESLEAANEVAGLLVDELLQNKLAVFLILKKPHILDLLRKSGFDCSLLAEEIADYQKKGKEQCDT